MLDGYRPMWLIVMFDCSTITAQDQKKAHKFRNCLLDLGFTKSQFSIYFRGLPSKEAAEPYKKKLIPMIPPKGFIQFLLISNKQFENISNYYGPQKIASPKSPDQLYLF